MRTWLSSDLHLGHSNILKYSNRPFKDCDEMNAKLIQYHNERVKPEDTYIHVGDFCFKSGIGCVKYTHWLDQMNGHKIMIKGNHDDSGGVKTYIDSLQMTFAQRRINVVHKPEHANPRYDINIVGHVHDKWKIRMFKEHYSIIDKVMNSAVPSDRQDWTNFLFTQYEHRNSESILFNCGVDVNNYRPVNLDEVIGQIKKWQNTK